MAGHQVSAASRPQSSLLADFSSIPGRRSPVGSSTIDDNSTNSNSMAQGLGNNGAAWNGNGIWNATPSKNTGAIGSGFGAAGDRRSIHQQSNSTSLMPVKGNGFTASENTPFPNAAAAFNGKTNSSALLQGDMDNWQTPKPGLPWAQDSSPSLSNVVATSEGLSSPPSRIRGTQQSSPKGLQDGASSPYYAPRPVIGPPAANGGLFDNNVFGDLRGRSTEEDTRRGPAFGPLQSSRLLGNGTRAAQVPNARILGGTPAELMPNALPSNRSGSLPRANSTPPVQQDENVSYSQTSQPNMQGQLYSTSGRGGLEDLSNGIGRMRLDEAYGVAGAQYYGQPSVNQYVTQQQAFTQDFYRNNNAFAPINQAQQMGWGVDQQAYVDPNKLEEYQENGGFQQYSRVGTMSPREMQQDFSNYQAAYLNGNTPPPSRGPRAMGGGGMGPMYRPPSFAGSDFSMYGRAPLGPHYGQPMSPLGPGPTSSHGPRSKPDDVYHNLRSNLLEEFRSHSKSNKKYELKDIYNHVVEFSGDQHGSRFIQLKLETANSDEKDTIFREIQPNSLQLMTDVFGNYVIQKFFEHGSQLQKTTLAKQMEGHVLTLSRQMYGCRVVQKALEHILMDQQAKLVKELDGHVLACVKDQNGNHVIQKAIERVPAQHIQFIIDAFHGQVHSLATHPYGCRVIQRMLEYCNEEAQTSILAELHVCAYNLVQDQYGNYVTQHVIQHGKPADKAKIIALITKHLLQFSKHKFASNVVEKSIEHGSEDQRRSIMEMIITKNDGTSPLQLLMKDQYGNYVIQKLLQLLLGKDRETLVEQVKPQLQAIKRYSFGKQITAIEKLIYQTGTPQGTGSPNRSVIGSPRSHSSKSSVDSPRSMRVSDVGKPGVNGNNENVPPAGV